MFRLKDGARGDFVQSGGDLISGTGVEAVAVREAIRGEGPKLEWSPLERVLEESFEGFDAPERRGLVVDEGGISSGAGRGVVARWWPRLRCFRRGRGGFRRPRCQEGRFLRRESCGETKDYGAVARGSASELESTMVFKVCFYSITVLCRRNVVSIKIRNARVTNVPEIGGAEKGSNLCLLTGLTRRSALPAKLRPRKGEIVR